VTASSASARVRAAEASLAGGSASGSNPLV
jgi:hypothetical protein